VGACDSLGWAIRGWTEFNRDVNALKTSGTDQVNLPCARSRIRANAWSTQEQRHLLHFGFTHDGDTRHSCFVPEHHGGSLPSAMAARRRMLSRCGVGRPKRRLILSGTWVGSCTTTSWRERFAVQQPAWTHTARLAPAFSSSSVWLDGHITSSRDVRYGSLRRWNMQPLGRRSGLALRLRLPPRAPTVMLWHGRCSSKSCEET
jgi:hypothetical protein